MTVRHVELPGRSDPLQIDDDRWGDHRAALHGDSERTRLTYAAAHVIMRESYAKVAHSHEAPGRPEAIAERIDWDATLRHRRYLSKKGFGIGEAMDTAQRMEIGWESARRLIEGTADLNLPSGFVAGAWTDHTVVNSPADLVDAVIYQAQVIQQAGGIPIVLSMPWLSVNACDAQTYVDVYASIIKSLDGPLFIHWLGEMFQPSLAGYFPDDSFGRIMKIDPAKVRGAKLSLLDDALEKRLRLELLDRDQILLTGDDLHFAPLIAGDDQSVVRRTIIGDRDVALGNFSHALLGIFDGIAAPAGLAMRLLDQGETERYHEIMSACELLSRVVFEPPTILYKVGLAFIAYLNGHQANWMLVNHLERERSPEHLLRVVEAAARAGALTEAPLAADRLGSWLNQR